MESLGTCKMVLHVLQHRCVSSGEPSSTNTQLRLSLFFFGMLLVATGRVLARNKAAIKNTLHTFVTRTPSQNFLLMRTADHWTQGRDGAVVARFKDRPELHKVKRFLSLWQQ